jgi:1,4-dihydroxy-2-naphthoyl-CoA hydrolase
MSDAPSLVDLGRVSGGPFVQGMGLVLDEASATRVAGHLEAGADHHTPWGVVHGGLYASVIETVASIGASIAVQDRGQFAVGVNNQTDFLRPHRAGRLDVVAEPIQQGRTLQLWSVQLTREDGKVVARGQLRLQNVPLER